MAYKVWSSHGGFLQYYDTLENKYAVRTTSLHLEVGKIIKMIYLFVVSTVAGGAGSCKMLER